MRRAVSRTSWSSAALAAITSGAGLLRSLRGCVKDMLPGTLAPRSEEVTSESKGLWRGRPRPAGSGGFQQPFAPKGGLQLQGAGFDHHLRAREDDGGDAAITPVELLHEAARPGIFGDVDEVVADAVLVEHAQGEAAVAAPRGGVDGQPSFRHTWTLTSDVLTTFQLAP